MSEEFRRALYDSSVPSLDIELQPPDLIGTTEILSDYHRESLCRHLPARAEGYGWTLIFSTSQHGFSLNSMYRKMYKLESPILLVIEDTDNNVSVILRRLEALFNADAILGIWCFNFVRSSSFRSFLWYGRVVVVPFHTRISSIQLDW